MKQNPPKLFVRFFRWYCHPKMQNYIEGDLMEVYEKRKAKKGKLKADLRFMVDVILLFRPGIIRPTEGYERLNTYGMYKSYFKIGWRNLFLSKGYSFISIGGLAIGMSIAILIGLWVYDELSFDQYHKNYSDLVQVYQNRTYNGSTTTGSTVSRPLEDMLRDTYKEDFKFVSLATWTGDRILSFGDTKVTKTGNYFQKDFPEMLSLKMLKGTRKGLDDPSSILLSESTAKALFGDIEPLNQAMRIDNRYDVKVTGVYEDLPDNTSFTDLKFISSWELYVSDHEWIQNAATKWDDNSFQLFAQLTPGNDVALVSEKIKGLKKKYSPRESELNPELFLHPMSDWHLHSQWKEGIKNGGRIEMVWLFGTIGVFVLLLACINFMNLSTARSEKRAKEVGIRLSIGSVRSQLIIQFLIESFMIVFLSFLLALGMVILSLPWFNSIADKQIIIDWFNPAFWMMSISFIFITGLLAGSYPAFYLSSFQPVKVLKGTVRLGRFASLPRKILVVVQFTVSVTLVIGTIVIYQQVAYTKSRPIGYNREGIIMIQKSTPDFYGKFDVLRAELKNSGAVEEISESSSPITGVWSNNGGFEWEGKDPDLAAEFNSIWITHEYGKTLNWKIKEGRDLSTDFATDSTAIILNEAAVRFMNVKDPVGMDITWNGVRLHVIGVVEDLITQSPYESVKQTVYLLSYKNGNWINLKLNPEKNASESIAVIESVFKRNITSAPFEYKFVEEDFAKKFKAEERMSKLSGVFALLAIFISCLGLFGLASFVAEQRTKEIGIRKVLGASVTTLWKMLSADFVILVIISCALAIPIAYSFMKGWLQKYQYHIEISEWVFIVTAIGALGITLLTVSYQAIKAALANPVKSLRSE